MPLWLQFIIIVSVLAGILFAAFALWLNFRERQSQIGTSMNELRDTVAKQQKTLEAAERRFQNLEAIVTSQLWDLVNDGGLPEDEKKRALSQASVDLDVQDEPSDAERAGQIARRLKT